MDESESVCLPPFRYLLKITLFTQHLQKAHRLPPQVASALLAKQQGHVFKTAQLEARGGGLPLPSKSSFTNSGKQTLPLLKQNRHTGFFLYCRCSFSAPKQVFSALSKPITICTVPLHPFFAMPLGQKTPGSPFWACI